MPLQDFRKKSAEFQEPAAADRYGGVDYHATVIDSVGDGVIVVDHDARITLFNPAAEDITGISRRQASGALFSSILANESCLVEMLDKTIKTGLTISDHENIILRNGSRSIPVSVASFPLVRADGENIGAILTIRDITYVRELEAAVRQADRLSTMGTLAAGLAHEIKNPLGGIKGAAQLLEQELPEGSELTEFTRVMIKEAERIDHLIRELLDLASPRGINLSHVNLNKVLDDILLLQRQAVKGCNITFTVRFDPSIPPILADGELLTRLFLNLIRNAVEALAGAGRIVVSTRILSDYRLAQDEKRSRMLSVVVEDNGPGIPSEELQNIWTPFFSTKTGGSGLGLTICHKIVSEHRGMIKVESEEGKGSAFTVLLPFVR